MNPRTRALITIGFVITILTSFFLFIFIKQQKQAFSDIVHSEQHNLQDQMELLLEQNSLRCKSRIKSLAANRVELIHTFIKKDRSELLKLANPISKLLKKENSYFRTIFFANTDNTIFLRTARPELYGDDMSLLSPLIVETNQRRKMMSGFEITKIGLNYRITYPIFETGEYIGLVGFAINSDFFLNQLHQTSKEESNIALVFPNAELEKAVFLNKAHVTIGNYVIIADEKSHFLKLPDYLNFKQKVQQIKLHGKNYALIQIGEFKNFKGNVIAMAFSLMNIESIVGETKRTIVLTLIFSFSLLFISLVIIYFNFNILFKKVTALNTSLAKNNKELEKRVKKRTEKLKEEILARQQVEEELKVIFKTIPDPIVVYNNKGHPLYANNAFIQVFGWDIKELRGRHIDFVPESEQQLTKNKIEEIYNTRDPVRFETKRLTAQGKLLDILLSAAVLRDVQGINNGIVVNLKDITQQNRMEIQLRQSQKIEAIGTLAGGIAHDFNNILFPIVGYTQMLLEDVPQDSPLRKSLDGIYTSALRAKDLVKQILTFSRQESGEMKLMKIQPIIKEALKLIRSTIPTTIKIKQDIQTECGVIKADPTQIHQIVMNLATNAYHAMEEAGGELKVSLKEIELGVYDKITPNIIPGTYACLTVADAGLGMDKDLIDKIFDPFFTTKEKSRGTGMGLSVVHGIVHRMGGRIQVYSEPGAGTQFHVYLPIEKSPSEEQLTHSKAEIQGGAEQILLVDDEDAIATMEKQMLEHLGYQVTSRTSSIDALEAFRAAPDKFDLVITDMAMPNMPGDKLSVELTKIRPDIPILLCTGFSETMSEEKTASLGINGFLLKPILMKDLAQKIREVLDKN